VTELRVILDAMVAPARGGVGRYAEELTRALIASAPSGATVSGVVSAVPDDEVETITALLPGLGGLHRSVFARRELAAAWQHGFTRLPGTGMIHATSLLAPLSRHDRGSTPGEQIAVTIHDSSAWTRPELLPGRVAANRRAMGRRAERYADAVVVPTHAVADELSGHLDLGDRIRVIGGAPSAGVRPGADAAEQRAGLGLPDRYVALAGAGDPHRGAPALIAALDRLPDDVAVALIGAAGELQEDDPLAGTDPDRVLRLPALDDAVLGAVLAGAAVYVQPSSLEGFGLTALEAASLGTPVIHSDSPALLEVMADAGLVVPLADDEGLPARLAEAITAVLDDAELARRLSVAGQDRARTFTWADSAEKVWQLHADL
jgi:glycosyltransferase involved in cell wall biosynthesis